MNGVILIPMHMPFVSKKKALGDGGVITWLFNAVFFLYLLISFFVVQVPMNPDSRFTLFLYSLIESGSVAGMLWVSVIALVLFLWGAYILLMFWNRFMTSMFKLRPLTCAESVALVLILTYLL